MSKKITRIKAYQTKRANRELKAKRRRIIKLRKRRLKDEELIRQFLQYWPKPEVSTKRPNPIDKARWLRFADFKHIEAPRHFSLIENTTPTLKFIRKIENALASNQKTFIILRNVTTIDETALIVLLSIMIRFRKGGVLFNGDVPSDPTARHFFDTSDFLKELYDLPLRRLEQLGGNNSNIYSGTSKKVIGELAQKVVRESSVTIWGQPRKLSSVYENLIELMANTHNHAEIGHKGIRNWYLVVKHMPEQKRVSFAFVDYGVGIIASLASKKKGDEMFILFSRLSEFFAGNRSANAQILERMFIAEERNSSTGLPYRGYGLPGLYQTFKDGDVKNLHLITNDVAVDARQNKFSTLSIPFKGTFVYWELDETCITL